jgi:peptidoglycan/xylan/chitin deacetylase (PgdA/CDA1 family)
MSFRGPQPGRPQQAHEPDSRLKRERIVALSALIVVAVVVVVIVVDSGGGSSSHPGTATSAASHAGSHGRRSASRPATPLGSASVPILVYHVINPQPSGSSATPALYVPPNEFSSQMQALKSAGWHAVTLDQLEAYWTHGTSLGPGKPIVLTFDNGYASQYTNALPVLKGLGWAGVLDLQLTGLPPSEGGLTDAQIRALIAAGWELDTQGLTHADLVTVDPAQLTDEVATARQTLRSLYGVPVAWFSYPYGDYNAAVIAAVRAAGYVGATTVNPGWASPQQDRFRLPRLVVAAGTTPSQLLAQIASAMGTTSAPPEYSGTGLA